jgi:hypothetical protein
MDLVVLAEASDGAIEPGHLVVGQATPAGDMQWYGYRFDPADLPHEFQPVARWRYYLHNQGVKGYITDESAYMQFLEQQGGRKFFRKSAPAEASLQSLLPPVEQRQPHAGYSCNPDSFHKPPEGACYNCISWGVHMANQVLPGFLNPVRQGRIGLLLQQLQPAP